jgi:hypothetical protein
VDAANIAEDMIANKPQDKYYMINVAVDLRAQIKGGFNFRRR